MKRWTLFILLLSEWVLSILLPLFPIAFALEFGLDRDWDSLSAIGSRICYHYCFLVFKEYIV